VPGIGGAGCVLYTYADTTRTRHGSRKDSTVSRRGLSYCILIIKDMDIDGLEAPSFNLYVIFFVLVD
jgi:hypothetical protein